MHSDTHTHTHTHTHEAGPHTSEGELHVSVTVILICWLFCFCTNGLLGVIFVLSENPGIVGWRPCRPPMTPAPRAPQKEQRILANNYLGWVVVVVVSGAGAGGAASAQTLNTALPQCPAWINNSCGHGRRDPVDSSDYLCSAKFPFLVHCKYNNWFHRRIRALGEPVVNSEVPRFDHLTWGGGSSWDSTRSAAHSWGERVRVVDFCRKAICVFENLCPCLKSPPLFNWSNSVLLQIRVVIPHGRFNRGEREGERGPGLRGS